MTPAQALDHIIPGWQASLPARFSPVFVVNLVSKHRAALEQMVATALGAARLKKGKRPKYDYDFAAYAAAVPGERAHDEQPDDVVVRRIQKWLTNRIERTADAGPNGVSPEQRWQAETDSVEMALTYVRMRAEAMLLRNAGWDAVPLLRRFPSLVIMRKGDLGAVRDWRGVLNLRPGFSELGPIAAEIESQIVGIEVAATGSQVDRYAMAFWARARALIQPVRASRTPDMPPDLRDRPWRTEANLQAMRLVATRDPADFTAADLQVLAGYSGWGGLSIEKVQGQMPPDLVPETFGLIHEYYTPTVIAEALAETLCPLLAELAGSDGVVRALEPSAGIGRLIRAFSPRRCLALEAGGQIKKIDWTAVEFSKVSSKLLRALRPDVDLHHMPFERWIREEAGHNQGTISLVVSNPPYGERGEMAREDTDEQYKEKRAYAYFMRRALDLLVPGGIGVFLVPAGFLSGNLNRTLREKLLRRHHLLGAFRLPSHDRKGHENVPGASVVMDMVFWRSRGGELGEVDGADQYIIDGDYFVQHKDHLLGVEDGSFSGDDEVGKTRSWRYKVTGELPTTLPPLAPRPVCTACVLSTIAPREVANFQTVVRIDDGIPENVDDDLRPALELGLRVGRYLAALGADEAEKVALLWPELSAALQDFAANFGDPARSAGLRALASKRNNAAQQILGAFKGEILTPALREPPSITPKFSGPPGDVLAQAEALFRQQRSLTVPQLLAFHTRQGGTLSQEDALAALLAAEWNLDGPAWDQLYPRDAYLTGNELWARHDRAQTRAAGGDEQARTQVRRLIDAIKPVVFEDLLDIDPRHGYVPLPLVSGWISDELNKDYGRVELERVDGFVQFRGYDYIEDDGPAVAPDVLAFLGYYNHDPELFKPPAQERRERGSGPMTREERTASKQNLAERRMAMAKKWAESFQKWTAADRDRRESLVHAYNRVARGRIVPTYTAEPLEIVRWGAGAPKLRAHQIAGARRVLDARGGLIAFDVGVGKTYTALAIIARARQEGWVRRPVILVPGSLVWKWHDDILCTLPDYRVLVIGSKRKLISRGDRKGLLTSETDTPQERAQKWQALQSGQVDVVVLSMDALARTKMNEAAVLRYTEQVEAVQRSIALRKRALQETSEKAKEKLSERERALLEHGVKAWVQEILALPSDWTYDPGVAWDDIGIDMLVVDEAAAFKNLHKPQAREDGVPKFMGGGGEGSDRAWQLDFRAAAVRKYTGGAGIVLLTATPAKNSPLEFYNLIQFIDPAAFTRAGILDPEQFIDRFLKIEYREVLDSTFEITRKSAVTGFKNLEDLRTIIFRYGEFRTSAEVGLKLPRPVVETLTIQMDEMQEAKYTAYVAQIERIISNPNPDGGHGNAILGLLARLSLVALHGSLDEGYDYRSALAGGVAERRMFDSDGEVQIIKIRLPPPVYASPKLTECARRVAASPHCGHIIFCEPTAVHQWMREVLVAQGVPRERIAILNAVETKPADRIRIAREFNGLSSAPPAPGTCGGPSTTASTPKFDVVIANSVAYEGIDLQVRTCSIHHLDLPWTPADLEQRNGRAVRQGNTLGTVSIFYYFADGSTDGYRFSLIDGKATWLGDLLKSQVRDTNNPAAQQSLTPEDILLMISRDKAKTRALLEDKKRRQVEEARVRVAREATRLLKQAAARFRDARVSDDPERAARLRDEGEQRLADLERVNVDAWPWAPWMYPVRDLEVIIPEAGPAVYEGLRLARPQVGAPDKIDYLEFGQIVETDEGPRIGLRAAGSPGWQLLSYAGQIGGAPILAENLPREGGHAWPDDDDAVTAAALEKKIPDVFRFGEFEQLRWTGASDAWIEKWWPRFESTLIDGLVHSDRDDVPVEGKKGLALASGDAIRGGKVIPPTRVGWQRFLELAPASGETFTALKDVGQAWWGRTIPHNLLAGPETPSPSSKPAAVASSQAPALAPDMARPRAGKDAAKALVRRLALMPQGVRVGSVRYHSPFYIQEAEEVEITFRGDSLKGDGLPTMTLRAAPRQGDEIDLRGELISEDGTVLASFDWQVMERRDLTMLKETSLARWFGVETTPERKLPPSMLEALAVLRTEEDAASEHGATHAWNGVGDSTRDALIARGLAIVLENTRGGFPHYQTTAAGRALLAPVDKPKETAVAVAPGKPARRSKLKQPATPAAPRPSEIGTTLDTFNAAPGYRLASHHPRANGHVFVVYREGQDAEKTVAAIDVIGLEVDDVRWLDPRVSRADQDMIVERLERALWAADSEAAESGEARSPLQDLTEMMERLTRSRGVDPAVSQRPYRTDGYTNIAEALAELAQPAQVDGEELQRWLESSAEGVTAPVRNGLMLAADVVGAARGAASIDVPDLMKTLWERVLEGVGITTVGRTDGPGMLLVPTITLRHQGLGKGDHILQRYHAGGRAMLRGIPVTVVSRDKAAATCVVEDPSGKLAVGSIIHHNNLSEEWLHLLYQKIDGFEEGLSQAARRLDDVQTLLYWTTAMLDAPLCQGDVKRRATAALEQAKAYYEAAHRQLIEGQSVDAVRRIHEALRRITTAAAELSKSCGDGQTALPGAEPTLVVTPADKAAIERPATMCAATSVLAGAAMHPASLTGGTLEASPAMMSGSAKPTPPQLRARFAAVSRERASEEGPVYYIFRRKSGRPELLTRDAIIAQTRAEVGDAVYDEAERNPMPGADLFDSCIGTVAMLLEAEFEGRADPRWAESILAGRQQEERERGAGEQKESRP